MNDCIALQTGHRGPVTSVAFSPQGTLVATASDDWNIKLWETTTGRVIRTLKQHCAPVVFVVFSPVDRLIASGDLAGRVVIWSLDDGTVVSELSDPELRAISSLSFSADGRMLVSATLGGGDFNAQIRLWAVDHRRLSLSIDEGSEAIADALLSPDGATIWSGGQDGKIKAWDTQSGVQKLEWVAHSAQVTSLALSPSGQVLASVGGDGAVRLWSATDSHRLVEIASAEAATGVDFSSDGDAIFVDGMQLRSYDARDGTLRMVLDDLAGLVQAVTCSRRGNLVCGIGRLPTGSSIFGDVVLWDGVSGRRLQHFIGQEELGLTVVAYSKVRSQLVSGDTSGRLVFWSLRSGAKLQTVQLPWCISSLSVSPSGRLVAVAGGDLHTGSLLVLGTQTRQVVKQIVGLPRLVRAATFSRDGRRLAAASEDGVLRLWRVETWQEERSIQSGLGLLFSVVFSNDGSQVFVGGHDGSVKAFDTETGELRSTFRNQTSRVFSLVLSSDGSVLASGGVQTAAVTIWNTQTGAIVRKIADPRLSPRSLLFMGNDTLVATNDNGRVLTLDLSEGSVGQLSDVHDMSATASVAMNETLIWTAGSEHAIHLFDIKAGLRRATLYDVNAHMLSSRQSLGANEYLAMDSDGFYSASKGAERGLQILHHGVLTPVMTVRRLRKRPKRVSRAWLSVRKLN